MKEHAMRLLDMTLEHVDRDYWWAGRQWLRASWDEKWGLSLEFLPIVSRLRDAIIVSEVENVRNF